MLLERLIEPSMLKARFFEEEEGEEEAVKVYLNGTDGGPCAVLCGHSQGAVGQPHFHHGSQFQLMLRGTTEFPDETIVAPAVHYADHNTPYGPFTMNDEHLMLVLHGRPAGQMWMDEPAAAKRVFHDGRQIRGAADVMTWENVPGHSGIRRKCFLPAGSGPTVEMFECSPGEELPSSRPTFGRFEFVWEGQVALRGKLLERRTLRYARGDETPSPLKAGPDGATVFFCSFDADVDKGVMGGLSIADRMASFKETDPSGLKVFGAGREI